MKKLLTLSLACVLFASSIYAGGFQINEHGARAMALGGAFTGLANDPSAIYFNPAGITQLKGTRFYFGTTAISPSATYTSGSGSTAREYEMKGQLFTPINFYITQKLGDKLAVGLGVNNQYGLGTKWNASWPGRYLAVNTEVRTFFITPVIAYELFNGFSISAGGSFVFGDVTIERKLPNPLSPLLADEEIAMTGDATSFGFTAGILYKLSDQFQFGVNYRSEVSLDFKGTATTTPATFYHPLLKVNLPFPYGDITAPLKTPQNLTVGLAYMPSDDVTFTADYQYIGWSSYNKLEVTFATYDFDLTAPGVQNVTSTPREYENTYIVRAGLEYKLSDKASLRAGLLYDHNPVQTEYVEPTLPDADRIGFNVGFGGKLTDNLGVDFSYMLLTFSERTVAKTKLPGNLLGTYSNLAHLFGVNFSYSL